MSRKRVCASKVARTSLAPSGILHGEGKMRSPGRAVGPGEYSPGL